MNSMFTELAVIVAIAAGFAIIFKALRQPAIVAYIIAGITLGALSFYDIVNTEVLKTLGEFGITFLLFLLGLEMKITELRSVGKASLFVGFGQILFTSLLGLGLVMLFGFSFIEALYISIAMTFSSTVVIVKLLSDKRDQNSLYGKISIGMLLIQDLVAIIILIFLSSMAQSANFSIIALLVVLLKALLLFAGAIFASKYIFPPIVRSIASSPEVLFIFSVACAFVTAAIVSSPVVGFSIEIGGLLAGLALASSSENSYIVARIRPLRDFFITLFFVLLGTQMDLSNIGAVWPQAIIFSLFILIGNPLIVLVILGIMGYHKKVGFLVGLTVAQISEFSLIVIFMGNRLGYLGEDIISLMALIGVVTFAVSSYMVINSGYLYKLVGTKIPFFQGRSPNAPKNNTEELSKHIILVGAHRGGGVIIDELRELDKDFVVVDFNPDAIQELEMRGIRTIFGDISDPEIQEKAGFPTCSLVISSNVDRDDNISIIKGLQSVNKDALCICLARDGFDARELYDVGASYVVIPRHSSGKYIAEILGSGELSKLSKLKNRDLKELA